MAAESTAGISGSKSYHWRKSGAEGTDKEHDEEQTFRLEQ